MGWKDAASREDAQAAKRWLPLTIDGADIVVATVAGTWCGFEDRCTHAGCAFSEDGQLDGWHLTCNCHGSEFDVRTGAVERGPAEKPIRTIPVRVVGDRIEVDL